jgi:hypothetical protein
VLRGDPLPATDTTVLMGHVLSYLPGEHATGQALTAITRALQPGGLLTLGICDLAHERPGPARRAARRQRARGLLGDHHPVLPARGNQAVRHMTTFLRNGESSWRRDDQTHRNVLIDTTRVPALLAAEGIQAHAASASGTEELPTGLRVLTGQHTAQPADTQATRPSSSKPPSRHDRMMLSHQHEPP